MTVMSEEFPDPERFDEVHRITKIVRILAEVKSEGTEYQYYCDRCSFFVKQMSLARKSCIHCGEQMEILGKV